MTLEEAKKVATVAETADGGCSVCVNSMVSELQEAFPEFKWTFWESEENYDIGIKVEHA